MSTPTFLSDYGYRLNEAQKRILLVHRPTAIRGDRFIGGDDNDLACVLSTIARRKFETTGDLRAAFEIESASPEGFFECSWERYQKLMGGKMSATSS